MKINEKNLYTFANSKPVDKEGYLMFKRDGKFQKRWFVLKGNLLFYFEKKGDKEVLGMLLLEGCTVELSAEDETQQYCFSLNFVHPGDRSYYMATDNQMILESWMKAITCASYDYVRIMVNELQRQLEEIDNRNKNQAALKNDNNAPARPPRQQRQNPFNKPTVNQHPHSSTTTAEITTKPTTSSIITTSDFLEPIKDDDAICNDDDEQRNTLTVT